MQARYGCHRSTAYRRMQAAVVALDLSQRCNIAPLNLQLPMDQALRVESDRT